MHTSFSQLLLILAVFFALAPMKTDAQEKESNLLVVEMLDAGLNDEQRLNRNLEVTKAKEKYFMRLNDMMTDASVFLSGEDISKLEMLFQELFTVEWALENIYSDLSYKTGGTQMAKGSERSNALQMEIADVLKPLNKAQAEKSRQSMAKMMNRHHEQTDALKRGDDIDIPEPAPFKPKTLTPQEKDTMRANRLETLNTLMAESGMTISADDRAFYLTQGERAHQHIQIINEHQYYTRYRGPRDIMDLPSFKKFTASASQHLSDSTRLNLIIMPLKIARLDRNKDYLILGKMAKIQSKFEKSKFEFTTKDVRRMAEISWELERISKKRSLILAERRDQQKKGLGEGVKALATQKSKLNQEKSKIESRLYWGK